MFPKPFQFNKVPVQTLLMLKQFIQNNMQQTLLPKPQRKT